MGDEMDHRLIYAVDASVADNQNSLTAGPRGPVLLEDYHLLRQLAHQNRKRIADVSSTRKVGARSGPSLYQRHREVHGCEAFSVRWARRPSS